MKQIKTFLKEINSRNDKEINAFLNTHNVKSINSNIVQGFTYTSASDYVSRIETTVKPSIITTVIYEVEK